MKQSTTNYTILWAQTCIVPAFKGCCPLTGLMIGTVVVDAATILTAPAGGKDDDDDDMVRCLDYSVQHCL